MVASSEPTIICEYGRLDLPTLMTELPKMMRGLLPGGVLRLESEEPDALWAVPAWCRETGNKVLLQSEYMSYYARIGCIKTYMFDIERGGIKED